MIKYDGNEVYINRDRKEFYHLVTSNISKNVLEFDKMEFLKIETFENILVSDLNVCLRGEHLDDVPRQFFVDWISLLLKVTKVKFPSFEIPAIPDAFKFEKSDYASSLSHEDYYNLNYYYCGLTDQNGCGINLTAFDGYQHPVDGTNAISIEPVGIPSNEFKLYSTLISSHINLYTYPPLATFIIGVEGDQKLRIEEIFEEHKKSCLAIQKAK